MCKTAYHQHNFYRNTFCVFEIVAQFPLEKFHYTSKKGSAYHFTPDGVYRRSNHWGRVGNCRWKLAGNNKMQNQYIGYASWDSFYPNSDHQAFFYIRKTSTGYDFDHYLSPDCDGKAVRKTSKETQNTLRKIKELDDPIWVKHYPELVWNESVKEKIIHQLIYTRKTFREILQEVVSE